MKKILRETGYFLAGQHFSEGLRITFAILLPALIMDYSSSLETGLALSLGALCVSLTDAPGPITHRRNGMLYCILVLFITTLITGFAQMNIYALGLEIVVLAFLFSMFNIYGLRAAAIGSAGLVVLILNMDKALAPAAVFINALLVTGGGIWYACVSLFFFALKPYRLPHSLLGDCIREMATFLRIKANFYNTSSDLEENYRNLVAQQIIVNEKQDTVREMLFKTPGIVKETNPRARFLIANFIDSVDLFEEITATYYDYNIIRERYGSTGLLNKVSAFVMKLAEELDGIGRAVQANKTYEYRFNLLEKLSDLQAAIEAARPGQNESGAFVLKKIAVNLRRLVKRTNQLRMLSFEERLPVPAQTFRTEHHRFVNHQDFSAGVLVDNMSFQSPLFRHALRTSLVCGIGFIMSKTLFFGQHSYWILLTIAFIMKPAFSLTQQRNVQRIVGTLCGGLVGVLLLLFVHNGVALFCLLVLFMVGTYSFLRVNYLVMVSCVTPLVLILFHFLGLGYISIVQERIIDTVIGCIIAFAASYLFLPKWEGDQVAIAISDILRANLNYLQAVHGDLQGERLSVTDYKLARKEVYVQSANLSATLQRMLSEPKSKRKNTKLLHQFVVLNHLLLSNIAGVASALRSKETRQYPGEVLQPVVGAITALQTALATVGSTIEVVKKFTGMNGASSAATDDSLLKEQLIYIEQLSTDIQKISRYIGK
ncbi:MAG: FUSC family membrane protein [Chitinophagaceae bacterium]